VNGDSKLVITIEGVPDQTYLTIDGQEAVLLRLGDSISCRKSRHTVKLMRMGANGFFDVLREKLKWGER
jgi:NAD+ kinase